MPAVVYADRLALPRDAALLAQARAAGAVVVAHGWQDGADRDPPPGCEMVGWSTSLLDRLARSARRLRAGHPHRLPPGTEQEIVDRIGGAGAHVLHAQGGAAALRSLPFVNRLGLGLLATLGPDDVFEAVDGSRGYARGLRALLDRADRVFATTPACHRRLTELGCAREMLELLPFGIAVRPLRARRAANRDEVRVVAAGPMVASAGHELLLEAVATLRGDGRPVRLELAGDGPLRARLAGRAAREDLAGRVELHDPLAGEPLDAFLDRGDLFVHPAREDPVADRHGPPEALVRAMAAGLCTLTTGQEGGRSLVRDEVTGLRCDAGAVEPLADGIARAVDDPALRVAAGAAGRVQVIRDYNLHLNALRLREAYAAAGEGDEER